MAISETSTLGVR